VVGDGDGLGIELEVVDVWDVLDVWLGMVMAWGWAQEHEVLKFEWLDCDFG
jgi:hypothetical protein